MGLSHGLTSLFFYQWTNWNVRMGLRVFVLLGILTGLQRTALFLLEAVNMKGVKPLKSRVAHWEDLETLNITDPTGKHTDSSCI